ncbi:MAG TPA: hypothetical protein VNZ58_01335 [Thermomicrobiales bacterium]|nr:hypothetical protein [Thermomicrobiales bacterium]
MNTDIRCNEEVIRDYQQRVSEFSAEAHKILSRFETATKSRVMSVDESLRQLTGLSLSQDALFREALNCISFGLYRSAHVAAWQAFMDFLEQKLASDGLMKLRQVRPKWPQNKSIEELREQFPEFQLLEVARDVGLLSKNATKSLQGMLSTRNDCAHPSHYSPSLNSALGYVTDLIDRIVALQRKKY